METYWNHNTAFHRELVADARKRGGRVLDVGCGDGLLLQRIAPYANELVGIDPDEQALEMARRRLAASANVRLIHGDFLEMPVPAPEHRFDTITCVAVLHHMELRSALAKMRRCLAPGGRLLIVGLAANKSAADFAFDALTLIPNRIMDLLHGGAQNIGLRLAEPKESLDEIRRAARELLPGAKVRRRFHFRYTLSWDKPAEDE
jgi:Methylase involved in ubiquinone/menaquinone biosynthesis